MEGRGEGVHSLLVAQGEGVDRLLGERVEGGGQPGGQGQLGDASRHALGQDDLGARGDGRARGRAAVVDLGGGQAQPLHVARTKHI